MAPYYALDYFLAFPGVCLLLGFLRRAWFLTFGICISNIILVTKDSGLPKGGICISNTILVIKDSGLPKGGICISNIILVIKDSGLPKGGMGSGPFTILKYGPQDFPKDTIVLLGGVRNLFCPVRWCAIYEKYFVWNATVYNNENKSVKWCTIYHS